MTFGASVAAVWLASAAALALVVAGFFRRRSFLLWLLAVASLWALAVRPHLPLPAGWRDDEATLRTAGASGEPGPEEIVLARDDAALVARRFPRLERVHVRGHGLRSWSWRDAPFRVVSFEPPALPAGPSFVHWRRSLPVGGELQVRGTVAGSVAGESKSVEMRLVGPAGVEDRAMLSAATFSLRARPRGPGPVLYTLEAGPPNGPSGPSGPNGQSLWRETIDLDVVAHRLPSVLWLEGAPSAESATFRRWLERQGGRVAMRSRPSRGRVRISVVGTEEPIGLRELTDEVIARFEVAVIDGSAAAASVAELDRLRAAVHAGRLGLLWRGREGATGKGQAPGRGLAGFNVRPITGLDILSARLRTPTSPALTEPLAISAFEIEPAATQQSILVDTSDRMLAARRLTGAGWSALSLLEGTFRWSLGGRAEDYAGVWTALLEAVAAPKDVPEWQVPSGPVLVDTPLVLAFDGEASAWAIEEPSGEVIPLAPRRDEVESQRVHFTYWPRASGWHRAVGGDTATWFHAQDGTAGWQAWQAARRQEDTRAFAARAAAGDGEDTGGAPSPPWRPRPLPRGPLFALLVASLGALWSIERFGRG